MKNNIAFVFISFVFMMVGRKLGWALSKLIFYPAPGVISFINVIGWGVAVAWGMSSLIGWLYPNPIIKWIFGFASAAYVAVPNYGLLQESSIPDDKQMRHMMISWLPLVVYVGTEIALRMRS